MDLKKFVRETTNLKNFVRETRNSSLNCFMKKYNLKDQTMSESDLQKVYNYKIYPRDSKITSNKGFVNIDNGLQGGTHWTCFYNKR